MYTFTIPRDEFDELRPDKQMIRKLIGKHIGLVGRLKKNMNYYQGKHKILDDENRENKLVCNHAKDISDTASSYFIGNPVSYKSENDITELTKALEVAGADEVDGDNGLDLSIYGLAYEYIYVKENEAYLCDKNISAENTFMVRDDSIEENELFAVYYYAKKDDSGTKTTQYMATILTQNYKFELSILNTDGSQETTEEPVPHYLGEIPIIEYLNNKLAIGDFELQIPLIDAYNALMSDRITDKEQFIDSILAIYGTLLVDDEIEEDGEQKDGADAAMKHLKKRKLLEMPDGTKAEYLTRTFDEVGVEILKKAVEQDIHKFSHIPCMTDESFGGNVSGVAMEFKHSWYGKYHEDQDQILPQRPEKKNTYLLQIPFDEEKIVDPEGITMTFTRALPKNLLEISQMVSNLKGIVSQKTLLAQIPFVEDVDEEMAAVKKESEESLKQQQEMFGMQGNDPPEENDPDKSSQKKTEEKKVDE